MIFREEIEPVFKEEKQPKQSYQEMKMKMKMDKFYEELKEENGISADYGVHNSLNTSVSNNMNSLRPAFTEKTFEDYLANETKKLLGTCRSVEKSRAKKAMQMQM